MATTFAGDTAVRENLGPAHAVALACGDQCLHRRKLVAAALPRRVALVAPHGPDDADSVAAASGLPNPNSIRDAR